MLAFLRFKTFSICLLLLANLFVLPAVAAEPTQVAFYEAQFQLIASDTPPGEYSQLRDLPDFWHIDNRYDLSAVGWYRFELPVPPTEGSPARWSVFLPKFTQNIDVYFNGHFVGSSYTVDLNDEAVSAPINWNRPHLFLLPPYLWSSEANVLELRLVTQRNWGLLAPVAVGPADVLEREYNRRFFVQITVNQISFWISLLLAVIAFVYWYSDRQATRYLWFALSCLSWAAIAANNFLQQFPLPVPLWSALFHFNVDFFGVGMMFFVHRFLGIRRRWLEIAVSIMLVFAMLVYLAHYFWWQTKVNFVFHGVVLLLGVYNAFIAGRSFVNSPSLRLLSLLLPLVVITLLTLHDNLFSRGIVGDAWFTQFYAMQLGTPLLLGFLLVVLSKDFVLALQAAHRANLELEDRVAEIGRDLERSYKLREQTELEHAQLRERERIYQDLHDDLGSKLLSLVYGAREPAQQELARSAIADIRSIISANKNAGDHDQDYVAQWHQEARHRCEEAGLELTWQSDPSAVSLSAGMGYHLTRIIRELLSNAIRHACCSAIEISLQATDTELILKFRDNGIGMESRERATGSGLQGIKHRIQGLSGKAEWFSYELGGTAFEATVPIS